MFEEISEEITLWIKSTLVVNRCVRQTIAVRLAEDGRLEVYSRLERLPVVGDYRFSNI